MDGAPFWTTSEADRYTRPVRRMLAPAQQLDGVKPCRIGASAAIVDGTMFIVGGAMI